MFFRSFRLKITLWSVLLSGVVVATLGWWYFRSSYQIALKRLDTELLSLCEAHLQHHPSREYWARVEESIGVVYPDLQRAIILRAVSPNKEILYRSDNWPDNLKIRLPNLSLQAPAGSASQFYRPPGIEPPLKVFPPALYKTLKVQNKQWRVCTLSDHLMSLSIAMDMDQFYAEIHQLRNMFFYMAPVALLLMAVGGWVVSARALRPIKKITQTAASITAYELNRRIPEESEEDEFGNLIQIINQMLNRLESSYEQAMRFSADASHELKTPLAILHVELENAIQQAEEGSTEQQQYSEILGEVQHLKGITRKLLLLSRADTGKLKLQTEEINLCELLREMAEDAEILASDRHIHLDVEECQCFADRVLLRQAIQNLIQNAITYGEPSTWIKLSLHNINDEINIVVANAGKPIHEKNTPHIFDRFYREDKSRERSDKQNAGLGLSLAREIIRAHGGDLILSQNENGTVAFTIILPYSTYARAGNKFVLQNPS